MDIEVVGVERLRFSDGAPVRAASAVVPFAGGFLVVSDDATHAAWFQERSVTAVRLLPPTDGYVLFSDATGTKHLKPDLEAACGVTVEGAPAALIMGSGSSPARMRWVLLRLEQGQPRATVADMTAVYASVADALGVAPADLNLEGACVIGDSLRWYHRGRPSAGQPSRSVDLDLEAAVAAVLGEVDPTAVSVADPRTYELGDVAGVGLAVTDVVTLPDGTVVASAAAEDTPNPRDDGPVLASGRARLDDSAATAVVPLPSVEGAVLKVEGLMVLEADDEGTLLLAVCDADDPDAASLATRLRVSPAS